MKQGDCPFYSFGATNKTNIVLNKIIIRHKSLLFEKKALSLHRSPGNSSPRLCAGDESGFSFLYNIPNERD